MMNKDSCLTSSVKDLSGSWASDKMHQATDKPPSESAQDGYGGGVNCRILIRQLTEGVTGFKPFSLPQAPVGVSPLI